MAEENAGLSRKFSGSLHAQVCKIPKSSVTLFLQNKSAILAEARQGPFDPCEAGDSYAKSFTMYFEAQPMLRHTNSNGLYPYK